MAEEKQRYFEAALSDFVFDVAAGGAVRHLVDSGYGISQIMDRLTYPVPRSGVEKAVSRYMRESGILCIELPAEPERIHRISLCGRDDKKAIEKMIEGIDRWGVENSYLECPFGDWIRHNNEYFSHMLSCLNARERAYLTENTWERDLMYHRLNDRMREITGKFIRHTEETWVCCYIKK